MNKATKTILTVLLIALLSIALCACTPYPQQKLQDRLP
jgi:hypothetical protein